MLKADSNVINGRELGIADFGFGISNGLDAGCGVGDTGCRKGKSGHWYPVAGICLLLERAV